MATIITNDNIATPQAGGSVCAIKTIKITLAAAEIVEDDTFNLGAPPSGWNFVYGVMVADSSGQLDTGTALAFSLGTSGAPSAYIADFQPTSAIKPIKAQSGSLKPFADGDLILTVSSEATVAADGTLIITLFGYA